MKKSKKTINQRKKNRKINYKSIIIFVFVILIFLGGLYTIPLINCYKSQKELNNKLIEKANQERKASELEAKLSYLSTKEGIKYIAKLNGFVEPGDIVIQLSENPDTLLIETPRKNIFGKVEKLACVEHTINGKPHYDSTCVVCQKLNELYDKKQEKERQTKEKKLALEKEIKKAKKNKKEFKKAELKNHANLKGK